MTDGLRAKRILKQFGIDSKIKIICFSFPKTNTVTTIDAAHWEYDNTKYFSTCYIKHNVWVFKVYYENTKKLFIHRFFSTRNELITYLIDKFNFTLTKLFGIYGYFDNNGKCVYIGKDKYIYSMVRHYQHTNNPTNSPIDLALQKNEYKYRELFRFESVDQMNKIEKELIKILKPKYNVHFKEVNNDN